MTARHSCGKPVFGGRIPTIRVAALLLVAMLAIVNADAAADFSGVWQAADKVTRVRTVEGKPPPLLPAAQAVYDRNLARYQAGDRKFDPTSRCIPPGMPRIMFESTPFEVLQRADLIVLLFEYQRLIRHIYLGGVHPGEFSVEPYLGHSVGHWEGATLVVDTIGTSDETFLDATGLPHSEALHIVEKIRLIEAGKRLEDLMTIEDPMTFSSPWQTIRVFDRKPGQSIREDVCLDREHLDTSLEE